MNLAVFIPGVLFSVFMGASFGELAITELGTHFTALQNIVFAITLTAFAVCGLWLNIAMKLETDNRVKERKQDGT